ncbi:hypothetical protein V9L05_21305 [Bernardetia sp. Wsw4-3y2]|uniref:hypothetical protein n=1 Tax=unclassified Bernardetia TaxID=2647129 RepID=UPI0030D2439D
MKQKDIKWSKLAYDNWRSLRKVFQNEPSLIGKEYTQGIKVNNCDCDTEYIGYLEKRDVVGDTNNGRL